MIDLHRRKKKNVISTQGLFSADELKQIDKSERWSKVRKIIALSLIGVILIGGISSAVTRTAPNESPIPTDSSPISAPSASTTSVPGNLQSTNSAANKAIQDSERLKAQGDQYLKDAQNTLDNKPIDYKPIDYQPIQPAVPPSSIQPQLDTVKCQQDKASADAPLITQINNLDSQISTMLQQQIQNAKQGTVDPQLNTSINSSQSQRSALQSQLDSTNSQYQC